MATDLNLLYTNKYPSSFLVEEEAYAQVSLIDLFPLRRFLIASRLRILIHVEKLSVHNKKTILPLQ